MQIGYILNVQKIFHILEVTKQVGSLLGHAGHLF